MKKLWSTTIVIALIVSVLITSCSSPGTTPNLAKAVEYLHSSYNPKLHLLYESPNYAPNTYWLVSDNLLAMQALQEHYPKISQEIKSELIKLTDKYNLPQDKDELPRSFLHETLIGEIIPLPFKAFREYTLESQEDCVLKTVIYDGEILENWGKYSDLLCAAALSKHYEEETEKAIKYFQKAIQMWDEKGIYDEATRNLNRYSTYKLGLLLFVSKVLSYPMDFGDELINRLGKLQAKNGGFFTDYDSNGVPIGDTNTETTAIVLLGLEDNKRETSAIPLKLPLIEIDDEDTDYCEVSQLIPFRGKTFAFIAGRNSSAGKAVGRCLDTNCI